MRLSERQLNRATLARQLLLRREDVTVAAAVRQVVALQAQEPASPYVALWNRVEGFDPAELDAAYAAHEVVKATLMRITLHAVHADDHPRFRLALRRTMWPRLAGGGLSVEAAEEITAEVLAFTAEPRRNAEVEQWLTERFGEQREARIWWALRTYAPLVHAPTGGPWSFGPRPAYLTAPTRDDGTDEDGALRHLVRRYLAGFGPASVADVAQFTGIARTRVRAAAAELERHEGPDGTELLDVPGGPVPDDDAPPRLMAMWDSVLLAYADRSRVIPPDVRPLVIRNNGDVLPTLLVDGHVAGVWRATDDGIEATAFRPLTKKVWAALEREAADLTRFLAPRDPQVYRRHRRWYATLPPGETRVLG